MSALIDWIKNVRAHAQLYGGQIRAWIQSGMRPVPTRQQTLQQLVNSPRAKRFVTRPWNEVPFVYLAQGVSWEWNVDASLKANPRASYVEGADLLKAYERDPEEALQLLGQGRVVFLYPFLNYDRVLPWLEQNFFVIMITWDDTFGFYAKDHVRRLSHADCVLSQMPENARKYLSIGASWLWMPEGGHASPECAPPPPEFSIVYVGNRFGRRGRLIAQLEAHFGESIHAYGPGSARGMIDSGLAQQLQREASVCIACSDLSFGFGLTHLKCRHFEIPCSGGLMLAEATEGLDRLYDIDADILIFRDFEECVRKIEWVRDNPGAAHALRKSGHARASRQHTWNHRFEELLTELHQAAI